MSGKTGNAQSRATFFRHSGVLSLPAVLLRKVPNEPMKTFVSGQSSIMSEHKTKDCAGLWPLSTSRFAPLSARLKFAEIHNHSPLLTMD